MEKKSKAEIRSTDQPAGSGFADMGLESARQVAHKCSRSQRSDAVTADTNRIPVSVTGVFVCMIWERIALLSSLERLAGAFGPVQGQRPWKSLPMNWKE